MSLTHFFLKNQSIKELLNSSQCDSSCIALDLDCNDYKHFKALRLRSGEHIGVIDKDSIYWECEIVQINPNIIVRVSQRSNAKKGYSITLFPGVSKSSKMDDVIRACTEIGIDRFCPILFERTVVKIDKFNAEKKLLRWNKIAKSAAMQSGQFKIPKVEAPKKLNDIDIADYDAVYVFWEEAKELLQVKKDSKNIAIFIGPEGGISKDEISLLKNKNSNISIASLGNSILRTETANIVASALVTYGLS